MHGSQDPKRAQEIHINLGLVNFAMGRYDGAISRLSMALAGLNHPIPDSDRKLAIELAKVFVRETLVPSFVSEQEAERAAERQKQRPSAGRQPSVSSTTQMSVAPVHTNGAGLPTTTNGLMLPPNSAGPSTNKMFGAGAGTGPGIARTASTQAFAAGAGSGAGPAGNGYTPSLKPLAAPSVGAPRVSVSSTNRSVVGGGARRGSERLGQAVQAPRESAMHLPGTIEEGEQNNRAQNKTSAGGAVPNKYLVPDSKEQDAAGGATQQQTLQPRSSPALAGAAGPPPSPLQGRERANTLSEDQPFSLLAAPMTAGPSSSAGLSVSSSAAPTTPARKVIGKHGSVGRDSLLRPAHLAAAAANVTSPTAMGGVGVSTLGLHTSVVRSNTLSPADRKLMRGATTHTAARVAQERRVCRQLCAV
jgi:hypothetical protein